MEWPQIASGLFIFGWSCIALYVAKCIHDMSTSVQELNIKMAVMIERQSGHEERIRKLEDREFA